MLVLSKHDKASYFEDISTLAERTQAGARAGVNHFEKFAQAVYKSTDEDLIKEIEKINSEKDKERATWDVLQKLINYLNKQDLQPNSIAHICNRVKVYLSYRLDVKLHNDDAKTKLKKPKQEKRKNHPLTVEEIRKILDYANPTRKRLYLFLISSGVRITEACHLRKRDFEKVSSRYKIHIRAKYTKTREARETFISKECEELVKPILNKIKDDDLVFVKNSNPFKASQNEETYFSRLRKKAGINARYDSGTNKISLHSFRAWFITKCAGVDMALGHALAGHSHYMKQYERYSDKEMLDFYLKAELKLSIYADIEGQDELKEMLQKQAKRIEELQKINDASKTDDKLQHLEDEIINLKKDHQKAEFKGLFSAKYYDVVNQLGEKPMSSEAILRHADNLANTMEKRGLLDDFMSNPSSEDVILKVIEKASGKKVRLAVERSSKERKKDTE